MTPAIMSAYSEAGISSCGPYDVVNHDPCHQHDIHAEDRQCVLIPQAQAANRPKAPASIWVPRQQLKPGMPDDVSEQQRQSNIAKEIYDDEGVEEKKAEQKDVAHAQQRAATIEDPVSEARFLEEAIVDVGDGSPDHGGRCLPNQIDDAKTPVPPNGHSLLVLRRNLDDSFGLDRLQRLVRERAGP